MPFVKLDCSILDSSLWAERLQRELFITALLMAVPYKLNEPTETLAVEGFEKTGFIVPPGLYGIVRASSLGIIGRAKLDLEYGGPDSSCTLEQLTKSIASLAEPDPWSRNADFEGRRMVRISGGFIILNFGKFRELDRTNAERQKRHRQKKVTPLRPLRNSSSRVIVTQAEAEAEADVLSYDKKEPKNEAEPRAVAATNGETPNTVWELNLMGELRAILPKHEMEKLGGLWRKRARHCPKAVAYAIEDWKLRTPDQRGKIKNVGAWLTDRHARALTEILK